MARKVKIPVSVFGFEFQVILESFLAELLLFCGPCYITIEYQEFDLANTMSINQEYGLLIAKHD